MTRPPAALINGRRWFTAAMIIKQWYDFNLPGDGKHGKREKRQQEKKTTGNVETSRCEFNLCFNTSEAEANFMFKFTPANKIANESFRTSTTEKGLTSENINSWQEELSEEYPGPFGKGV